MTKPQQPHATSAKATISLMEDLLIPAATVFRTTKVQPELDRFENDAEHSFLLATLGCALAEHIDPALDLGKISQYALVHDLVEVYAGDTTIWAPAEEHASKAEREHKALQKISQRWQQFPWLKNTIAEYEKFADPESCFVYALDKIIPYLVMAAVNHQPFPPHRATYEEKVTLAHEKIARYPALIELFEEIDEDYRQRPHFFADENTQHQFIAQPAGEV
jgi:putative hydrolase of HD superfamily